MADEEAGLSSPSGSASPGPGAGARRAWESFSEAESMELLASAGIKLGRLVYKSRYGPTALPVAYQIDAGSIVMGTWDPVIDEDLRTGIENAEYQVAVEADQIDLEAREGWTVLVYGAAHHMDTETERAPFAGAGLEPWLEEIPAHFIRVTPTHIWGAAEPAVHDASGGLDSLGQRLSIWLQNRLGLSDVVAHLGLRP